MEKPAPKDFIFVSIQLLLFVLYFIPLFDWFIEPYLIVKYISIAFAIIGVIIFFIAIIQLDKNLTPFPTPKSNGTLIQSGLYKYIRHPVYSGIILTSLGFGIYNGIVWRIGIGIMLWILFYFKSIYEEKMLSGRFTEYEEYVKKTNRFFPFL